MQFRMVIVSVHEMLHRQEGRRSPSKHTSSLPSKRFASFAELLHSQDPWLIV